MYTEANIIYFTPYYFPNGRSAAKPKYFIVLKNIDGKIVLAGLPTRKDAVPDAHTIDAGCVEVPSISMNCFVISDTAPVTQCNKTLEFKTFLYGHELDSHELQLMDSIYKIEGSDYVIYGKMRQDIFDAMIECFRTSRNVKNKYVRMLSNTTPPAAAVATNANPETPSVS